MIIILWRSVLENGEERTAGDDAIMDGSIRMLVFNETDSRIT